MVAETNGLGLESSLGGPTQPIHITNNSWQERFLIQADFIADRHAVEGNWQSYIDSFKLFIPEELQHLFKNGGVITASPDNHLLLFGNIHWIHYMKLLAKETGLSPILTELARNAYENMHRFSKLDEDGSITITPTLIRYANIDSDVAIIGMIYHAEIHNKDAYVESQKREMLEDRKKRFRDIK